jgi:plastocyanin
MAAVRRRARDPERGAVRAADADPVKALAALVGIVALGAPAPARVQVVAKEYSFGLSRTVVRSGPAVVQLANFGEDPHDLRLQRVGARHVAGLGVVAPGGRAELSLNLPPGRYSLWCSVANHRALGMRAVLVVKPR